MLWGLLGVGPAVAVALCWGVGRVACQGVLGVGGRECLPLGLVPSGARVGVAAWCSLSLQAARCLPALRMGLNFVLQVLALGGTAGLPFAVSWASCVPVVGVCCLASPRTWRALGLLVLLCVSGSMRFGLLVVEVPRLLVSFGFPSLLFFLWPFLPPSFSLFPRSCSVVFGFRSSPSLGVPCVRLGCAGFGC